MPQLDTTHSSTTPSAAMDARAQQLQQWLQQHIKLQTIQPLVQDASFRRYFRITTAERSYIAMDAPPHKEACAHFVCVGQHLKQLGVNTPNIKAADVAQGFLLLTDFGDSLYLSVLNPENCDQLYTRAMQELHKIQQCQTLGEYAPGNFCDHELMQELEHFRHWYLQQYKKIDLNHDENAVLDRLFAMLLQSGKAQPQVFIHRDYHSRNLMQLEHQQIGILDFQDAMWGPITYDLASMLRDCYIVWPQEQVKKWVIQFYQQLPEQNKSHCSEEQFIRYFDWMGLQRHLKAIFIFARKSLRDSDPRYLEDIPRGLHYVQWMCEQYSELRDFQQLLQRHRILPT